jgi:integrase
MTPAPPAKRCARSRTETIKFLTPEETGRLFSVIKSRRDRALFLIAYRHGLRADEIGLFQTSDFDLNNLRAMFHRLKGSLSDGTARKPNCRRTKGISTY